MNRVLCYYFGVKFFLVRFGLASFNASGNNTGSLVKIFLRIRSESLLSCRFCIAGSGDLLMSQGAAFLFAAFCLLILSSAIISLRSVRFVLRLLGKA